MKFGKCLLIYNPISGPDKKRIPIEFITENLKLCGIKFDILITEYTGHTPEFFTNSKIKYDTIICSGGDGSVNEIINSIAMEHNPNLLLIPQGTGNDLNRSLKGAIPSHLSNILDFTKYERTVNVDVGLVEGIYSDGTPFKKKFCNAIGLGLDSLIAKYVSEIKKRNNFSYIFSLLKAIVYYKPVKGIIESDKVKFDKEFILLSINNGKCSGGGFYLAPDAKLDDGELDLCFINVLSKPRIIINFSKVLSNRIKEFKEVELFQSKTFNVTMEQPYYLHIDGEMEEKKVKSIRVCLTGDKIPFILQ